MGNKKWTRVLALVMAVVCTLTVVAAAGFDHNGDGKFTVWDLQGLFASSKETEYKETLKQVLGGNGDELNPVDEEGKVYEIYTAFGLQNMASLMERDSKNGEGMTFKLMNDIDMKNVDWYPIYEFKGTFDGDGDGDGTFNTIRNVRITRPRNSGRMGFFAKIGENGVVKHLKMENVTVEVTDNKSSAYLMGLLAGSITGLIEDCNANGTVIDTRTAPSKDVFVGTLTGRIDDAKYTPGGINITDANKSKLLMKAEDQEMLEAIEPIINTNDDKSVTNGLTSTLKNAMLNGGQNVLCKMALDYGQITNGKTRYTGIVGYQSKAPTYNNYDNYNWQDISGSIDLQDPVLAQRRQAVVDKMEDICTVEWTPSKTMTRYFYKAGATQEMLLKCVETRTTTTANQKMADVEVKTYTKGTTYHGMPYMHAGGSLERFESWLENGKTKTTLPTETYYSSYGGLMYAMNKELSRLADPNETASFEIWTRDENKQPVEKVTEAFDVTGMVRVDQGLETVNGTMINADIAGYGRYLGNDCSQAIMWAWREVVSSDVSNGGTVISGVRQMAPTEGHQSLYGVQPVNGIVPTGYDMTQWEETYANYGKMAYMEAYAQASRGDALICNATAGGHSRLIAYDPIVIRAARGGVWSSSENKVVVNSETIKSKLSYVVTHEQGRGTWGGSSLLGTKWYSDCFANCVYTFEQLTFDDSSLTNIGVRGHYMPMTLPVFHDVNSKAANTNEVTNSYIKWENGAIKSNFYILSTKVGDAPEVFTGVTQHQSTTTLDANGNTVTNPTYVGHGYRDARVEVTLDELIDAHGEDVAGKTVTVKLSNGYTGTVTVPAA